MIPIYRTILVVVVVVVLSRLITCGPHPSTGRTYPEMNYVLSYHVVHESLREAFPREIESALDECESHKQPCFFNPDACTTFWVRDRLARGYFWDSCNDHCVWDSKIYYGLCVRGTSRKGKTFWLSHEDFSDTLRDDFDPEKIGPMRLWDHTERFFYDEDLTEDPWETSWWQEKMYRPEIATSARLFLLTLMCFPEDTSCVTRTILDIQRTMNVPLFEILTPVQASDIIRSYTLYKIRFKTEHPFSNV